MHVDDIEGTARKDTAEPLLRHLDEKVGQCKADCNSFLHAGILHEYSSGVVFTRRYIYIGSVAPIDSGLFIGKHEEAECDTQFREGHRSVFGVAAWAVLTRAELAVDVQALQRRAHPPRIKYCKRLNIGIRYMKRHKCGLKQVTLQHLLKLVAPIDAAFAAQPEEPIDLALRGLALVLCEDRECGVTPHVGNGKANPIDFMKRRQRSVVRSTFSAELNGLVVITHHMLPLRCTLHPIYCGTARSPERMIDLLERCSMHPPLDLCAAARAVYDAIAATDVCEPAGSTNNCQMFGSSLILAPKKRAMPIVSFECALAIVLSRSQWRRWILILPLEDVLAIWHLAPHHPFP